MAAKVKFNWGIAPENMSVDFFVVWNSSDRKLYVLAKDLNGAMGIAHSANHIHYMDDGFSKDVMAAKLNLRLLGDFEHSGNNLKRQ